MFSGCNYNRFAPIEPNIRPLESDITIGELKKFVSKGPVRYDYVLRGVVTSSDSSGNFYKQLFIEDSTGAIEVRLGLYDIFASYHRWDSVAVKLNMLSVGAYNSIVQLGYGSIGSSYVDPITSTAIMYNTVFKQCGRNDKFGQLLRSDKIDRSMAGRVVFVEGQFANASSYSSTFKGRQDFLTPHGSVIVYTSDYAKFANVILPRGGVRLRVIITFDKDIVLLKLSDLSDVARLIESPNKE